MSSELIALLEKEAAAERERILSEARAEAEAIRAAAREEAQRIIQTQREQQEARLRAAGVRAESTASLRAAALVLEEKDRAIAEVFRRAEAQLTDVRRDPSRYGKVLGLLVDEAAGSFTGRLTVEVPPEDMDLVRSTLRARGLDGEVRTADGVTGGVRLLSHDGRFVVVNTLGSRLERARPALASEIARVLWG